MARRDDDRLPCESRRCSPRGTPHVTRTHLPYGDGLSIHVTSPARRYLAVQKTLNFARSSVAVSKALLPNVYYK